MNNHTRGGGWWRWKPYYLLRELRAVRQGDVLVRCAAAPLRRCAAAPLHALLHALVPPRQS